MGFYDHKCLDCKKESEHFYSMKEDPKKIVCPHCGSKNTERLMGAPHIGWERKIYKTFIKGDDERAEAEQTSHMGREPYERTQDELIDIK